MTEEIDVNPDDCFKILLATDIHLGYNEKDIIRGNDSFIAFQEILYHARAEAVDFILLGGDLFHDTNPSKETLNRCLQMLHEYTLGDKPIEFEILSQHDVNYLNPNMNVAIPVFSIHGNHDDPSGYGGLSSVDILSTSGVLNYFGRCDDLEKVEIDPVLLKKGQSQLAIYGLSHIHDNRLARIFRDSKVMLNVPDERSGEWFNLMVLHQNRVDRGPKNFVPEEILPENMDLILWGHEHDCRVQPESVAGRNYMVTQPGSSVATSLSEGESLSKHIAVVSIIGDKFKLEPIKLKTVRPFIFKSINLVDYEDELEFDDVDIVPKIKELLAGIIEDMIANARELETDSPAQPKRPLIRLRVHYKDESHCFNAIRFGQQYNERVANPAELLKLERNVKRTVKAERKAVDEEAMRNAFNKEPDEEDDIRLEDYVDRYFNDPNSADHLQVLHSKSLSEMCRRLAESQDKDAAKLIIDVTKEKACHFLNEKLPEADDIDLCLGEFRESGKEVFGEVLQALTKRRTNTTAPLFKDTDIASDRSSAANGQSSSRAASAGRGGRGARTTKATTSTAAAKATANGSAARGGSRSTRATQPTLAQTMARSSQRSTNSKVVYMNADSDSD